MATGMPDAWINNAAKLVRRIMTFCTGETQIVADKASAFIWDSGAELIEVTRFSACGGTVNATNVTVDLLDDGVSVLDSPIDLATATSGVPAVATLAAGVSAIAANSKMSINLVCNGGGAALDDVTIVLEYRPEVFAGD